MDVRATITVTNVTHYRPGTDDASTVVTLKGEGEEAIKVYWQLPGWVPFVKGDEYEVRIERRVSSVKA